MDESTLPATVIFKWDCDRSSGHSRYKQRWTEEHDTHDDSNMSAVLIEKLKQDLGLLVKISKSGCGATNDGNSVCTFFNNPQAIAAITGIKQNIIEGFAAILKTTASGIAFKYIEAFGAYTTRIAKI
ncbi:hypothetical protein ILUMI_13199, partial [Ignelater luminosus]